MLLSSSNPLAYETKYVLKIATAKKCCYNVNTYPSPSAQPTTQLSLFATFTL